VIALARRALPAGLEGPALRALPREEVEAGMDFMGFAVFQVRTELRQYKGAGALEFVAAVPRSGAQ
jgi:hypothetical protein